VAVAALPSKLLICSEVNILVCALWVMDSPPLGFQEKTILDAEVCRRIKECAPDVLFVTLGAPK
jgi:hypothetical protein